MSVACDVKKTTCIVTYNIHKGFSQFNRHMMSAELRETVARTRFRHRLPAGSAGMHERHAEATPTGRRNRSTTFSPRMSGRRRPTAATSSTTTAITATRFSRLSDHPRSQPGRHASALRAARPAALLDRSCPTSRRCIASASTCRCSRVRGRRQMDALAQYLEDIAGPRVTTDHRRRFQRLAQRADELVGNGSV